MQIKETSCQKTWENYRKDMFSAFPSAFRDDNDSLAEAVKKAVEHLNKLRPNKNGPAYLGENPALTIDFEKVKDTEMPHNMGSSEKVIEQTIELFEGLPNWGHPLTMCNVIPQANTASIIAAIMSEIFSPNILEGEYSWNTHRAELESAGMLANLVGWESKNAGCVYTYGGSGCWTYHVKYALTRVLPNSRKTGIRTDAKVLCSQQAHYTMLNSTDWMGLGMNNIIRIKTDPNTNSMDMHDLENVLKSLQSQKVPVASVVCTMGTTDANAFDPVAEVRALLDKYPNPAPYGKALLYCDAVTSWSWLAFKKYDFEKNPLQFTNEILPFIKANLCALKAMVYADAIGFDFHKAGFTPYISSCFVYRDAKEFESILKRPGSAYLQPRSPYNPLDYTLEVSRAATGALAGWATMKYFGYEGFQAIMGGILENQHYLRKLLHENSSMVCANPDDYSLVTLFRVYPPNVIAHQQYQQELSNPLYKEQLLDNNKLILDVGNKLYEWYRSGKKINGKYTPYMSFSTGFRVTEYNRDESDPEAKVFALKVYPMNIHITHEVMEHVIECVMAARDEVINNR
ncbi:pyridoxal-dependent decarboxylase (plasmid) [Escherichia albertii]|uniref:pyridoxal phosphate-dependent decarboxylase family protein n=1 Tax=Escherichia albertii TaxID=208962 RepID=UPI0023626DFC|nr:pyridoxal-dependent decarboxylase [Escherichia albertii]WDB54709.1 pyridoxal-dependent decarboxylase [Escherichia albertii]